MATQLPKVRPYRTTVIQAYLEAARSSWQGSFLQLVPTVCRRRWDRSANEILFWVSVVSLVEIYKCAKYSPLEFTESTSNPQNLAPYSVVGDWCAVSARRIVVPVLFNERVNCERYVQVIPGQFFPELTEERHYVWFQQDSATARTAHMYMQAMSDICGDRIISSGIW
jgi:hypothetical protein